MMDPVSGIGYVAASLVGVTFYMKSMVPLRGFAIASNVCFILYAYLHVPQLYPVLILHLCLLPLNIKRLFELRRRQPLRLELLSTNRMMVTMPMAQRVKQVIR